MWQVLLARLQRTPAYLRADVRVRERLCGVCMQTWMRSARRRGERHWWPGEERKKRRTGP